MLPEAEAAVEAAAEAEPSGCGQPDSVSAATVPGSTNLPEILWRQAAGAAHTFHLRLSGF